MICFKLAETVFGLESLYAPVRRMLREYETAEAPEYVIRMTAADAAAERKRSGRELSEAYAEALAVYRKVSDYLLEKDVLLFHGSAVAVDGEVYLFAAPSGTGKSTHARLWAARFGARALMVNDDKPLLGLGGEGVTVYGTPWDGKHHLSANVALPLKAVCLLQRAAENTIRPVTAEAALPRLLRQAYRGEEMARILPLVLRLAEAVPLYELSCNMEPEAAEVAWRGMQSGSAQ